MSDLVGNPEDRFSCDAAHLSCGTHPTGGRRPVILQNTEIISFRLCKAIQRHCFMWPSFSFGHIKFVALIMLSESFLKYE